MRNAEPEKPPLRDETFDKPHDTFFLVRWFSLHTFLLLYRSFKDPLKRTVVWSNNRLRYVQPWRRTVPLAKCESLPAD